MEDEKTIEINQETQPIAYAQQTRADRLREASSAPDFTMPAIRPVDDFFSESVMEMDDYMLKDIMRQTGITESTSEQVSTAISNALIGMNQLKDETKIAYGNLANYFTGGKIGDEIAQVAYESITQRYNEMANAEEAIGGIRSELAKLAGGAASFTQLALEGMATFGVLPLAHIGIQEFGQGTYNDMKAYADKHDGSLKGYEPEGFDLAANFANSLLQVGIESWLGVGSPRFLVGASRGAWVEGLSGALQEGVQGALSDLTEAVKGNQDISILLDNAEDYLRDAIIGGVLQGSLGAVTHHQNYARAVDATAKAIAKAHGHEEPTAQENQTAKAIIDAKERQEASILTQEFKAAFDASTGEGQLQAKIVSALKKAAETKELDLDTANETEMAQRIEQIATQETLNAMDFAREQNRAISDMELNNIVYKDGAIWLEGLTPEVGDKAVSYARVLAERQSGLAELKTRIDANTREIQQLKADLAEAKAQKQESRAQVLQARIDKQNAIAEKNRLRAQKLEAQTAKLEKQIAKQIEQVKVAEPVKTEKVSAEEDTALAEKIADGALKATLMRKKIETDQQTREAEEREELARIEPKPVVRTSLKKERATTQKNRDLQKIQPDAGIMMLDKEKAEALLKEYEELLQYKNVDVKKIKDKAERAKTEALQKRLRDIEYNIEHIKYYAGQESTYVPKDVNEILTKWGSESATREETGEKTELTKSKKRVRESAEVYTPKWVVNDMLNLIPKETWEDIDATFLEPAGGNGNFVEEILRRKLAIAKTTDEKIRALKSVYAIELMLDNVDEMRARVKAIMAENGVTEGIDDIINKNIQQGNFLTGENIFGEDITFVDWKNGGTDTLKEMIARGEAEQAEKRAKEAEQEKLLFQGSISGKGDTARGGYDEQLKRIILGEKSDLSTIQHEFAHYWMQNNFKWARSGLASQDWLRKWRDVEEWLGIEPQDRLLSKSASEKFAKAYERYILEGKVAPELQWAFEGFQKAYQDIYEEMESEYFDLNEELAPEVVDWFNRNKEQSPRRLLEADTKKIEKQITLSAGASVIEDVADTVVMTEPEANGDQKVYMGVKESEIPAGDNLLVQADKTTASKLQQSAKKWLSDKVEVQQLATLDTQATLKNFRDWIARDRAGAWDAMMNPDTRPIYRTYLYKAFAQEALNDADLAVELANIDMAESVRELGQAIQALDIRNESGFDTIEIIRNLEKSKGKISTEELNKEVESIGLDMVELSQAEIDEVDFDTECKL